MSSISSYFLFTALIIAALGLASFWIGLGIGRRLWRSHRRKAVELRTEIARLRALIDTPPAPSPATEISPTSAK